MFLLILSAILGFQTVAQQPDLVQRLEQVATLIRENRLTEAEKELAPIARAAPGAPATTNLLGTIRAKQGRLNEAEALFLQAVRKDDKFTGARLNLAYLYLLKREHQKAIFQLREVLRLEPDNAEAADKLAELLFADGHFDECISVIEKQRQSRALSPELLVMLGDAYFAKGAATEAEQLYLLALEGRLDNAGALLGLAQISRAKGELREASLYITRVATLTADSKSPEFLYKFALIAISVGMIDPAKDALERTLKMRPNDPSFLLALGIAWLRRGDLFESEKIFRRVIELQPNNARGQLHLGYVLLNQKKYGEARVWLEKSAQSNNSIPEVFYYLGLVAQEQNDDARAIALFEKTVQKLPNYVHARVALGSSYMKLKDYTRAQQELETAVKIDPDEPKAHYNLALLYARLKDTARAQEEMRIIEKLKAKGVTPDSGVVVLPPTSPP